MARQEVVAAVDKVLAAEWDQLPVVPQNVHGEITEGMEAFLIVQYPASRTRRMSVSTPYFQEEGGFRLVLQLPRGEGTARALILANKLAGLFRYREIDGVKCLAPTSPNMDDSNDQGAYFTATVVVPYTFDFIDPEAELTGEQP